MKFAVLCAAAFLSGAAALCFQMLCVRALAVEVHEN
jgi:hypothetical protein